MTQTPPDPQQPGHEASHDAGQQPTGYPAAPPPPPPGTQGGWGDVPGQAAYSGGPYGGPPAAGPYAGAPYADWVKRVGGYLVDVVLLAPAYVVAFVGAMFGNADSSAVSAVGALVAVVGYLAAIGFAIWNMVFRQGRTGWSIGKQVVGIRLIGEQTGQPIGAGLNFVRMLVHVLDSLPCYLGYLWPLWDPKRQTFADKIMSTVVIEQKKA